MDPRVKMEHQLSSKNFDKQEKKVKRIYQMIPKGKYFDLLSNSLNLCSEKMYEDQSGEFVWGY